MKRWKILLPLAALALGVIAAVLLLRLRPQVERREVAVTPPLVRVVEAVPGDYRLDVASQGTVVPRTASTLVAQVTGRIVAVAPSFADGGFFRRGDVLVTIDDRDYRLALAEAEAAVALAEVQLQREQAEAEVARQEWGELGRGEAGPLVLRQPQLAEARARLEAAGAGLARAELELSRTRVTAPFDGRVRSIQADVGQYLGPGTPLAALYATDYAEVRLPVAQRDLGYLDVELGADGAAGPEARLAAELGGRRHTWQARVVRTAGEIDPRSRMLDLIARIDDPYRRTTGGDGGPPLPVGLFVEAEIAGRTAHGVIAVPRSALRDDGRVLVVDGDDRLRFRDVEVLKPDGESVVVSGGLEAGERVVISPLATVVDGMRVRTRDVAEDGAAGRGVEGRL